MHRRFFNWVALVAVGLAGVVAVSAATALAARSGANSFELVFTGRYEPYPECVVDPGDMCFDMQPATGTFMSSGPFCESGTAEELRTVFPSSVVRRYTCADGSGSLTLSISDQVAEYTPNGSGEWEIVEGSGRYESLRGKGTYTAELLGGNPASVSTPLAFRTRAQGVAAVDAGAPSAAFTSATATKLRRPAGAYLIRVALALRDDVEGTPVEYSLRVTDGRRVLAITTGETASGSVSTTLRIQPSSKRMRTVVLRLYGSDWIGNGRAVDRVLRLPRS